MGITLELPEKDPVHDFKVIQQAWELRKTELRAEGRLEGKLEGKLKAASSALLSNGACTGRSPSVSATRSRPASTSWAPTASATSCSTSTPTPSPPGSRTPPPDRLLSPRASAGTLHRKVQAPAPEVSA